MQKRLRRFIIGDLIFIVMMLGVAWMLRAAGVQPLVAVLPPFALGSLGLALLLSTIVQERRTMPMVRRLRTDEHRIHWHYPPGVWRELVAHEAYRELTGDPEATVPALARTVAMYTLSAAIVGFFLGLSRNALDQALQIGLIIGGIVLLLSLIFAVVSYRRATSLPPRDAVDVYIGQSGMLLPERYVSFADPHLSLVDVRLHQGSPAIVLFETRMQSNYHRALSQILAVPVPAGREAEATRMVEQFRAEVPRP